MKINAIRNTYTPQNKTDNNHQKPSFAARVNVIWESTKDVISGDYIELTKEPLRTLVATIKPHLEKLMDDNLLVDVTGAGRPTSFWNIFKAPVQGLKFDFKFHDIKKYYYEVLMKEKDLDKFIDPQHLQGLKDKDELLLCGLRAPVGVGRLYEPQKGDTPEKFVKDIMPKIKEHIKLMPKFHTERTDFVFDAEKKEFIHQYKYSADGISKNGDRYPWEYYRGIEFDYPPVFEELYK